MGKKKKQKKTQPEKKRWHATAAGFEGFFLLVASILLTLSLWSFSSVVRSSNWLGLVGYTLGWILHYTFGFGSYLLVMCLVWVGVHLILGRAIVRKTAKFVYACCLLVSCGVLLTLLEDNVTAVKQWAASSMYSPYVFHRTPFFRWLTPFRLGGVPFHYLYCELPYVNLEAMLNVVGTAIVFSSTFVASLFLFTNTHPSQLLRVVMFWKRKGDETLPPAPKKVSAIRRGFRSLREKMSRFFGDDDIVIGSTPPHQERTVLPDVGDFGVEAVPGSPFASKAVKVKNKPSSAAITTSKEVDHKDYSNYQLPPLSLLTHPKKVDQSSLKRILRKKAEVLEETLLSFSIEAKVGQINCGPSIVSFEVHPAVGVKVQKIKALENDIALNMEARSIRIIAPIPGKAVVGIEVPNPQPQEVGFKELLGGYQQSGKKHHIPLLLGKTVNGDHVMTDLTKMPHLIIAGATGSGKSVCINTLVMSILMNAKPDEIRLLMIDPKKVELTSYSNLPHMLSPVITEPEEACAALNWLTKEMDERYELLRHLGVRNIQGFNHRRRDPELEKALEESLNIKIPGTLPYIVGIIDELADLMMVSSQDIETPIARIAQMARAVGIHLVLATQRPSREVLTGLIKANFPTRIAFKVASRINSQIILDDTGAEALLGNGDMLFLPPGSPHLVRAQGVFVRDEDIGKVVGFIGEQEPANYVMCSFQAMELEGGVGAGSHKPLDALYQQAYDLVIKTGNASTTFLQRKLKIGYARAAGIMDQLQDNGVVGPSEGAKPRKVLSFQHVLEDDV